LAGLKQPPTCNSHPQQLLEPGTAVLPANRQPATSNPQPATVCRKSNKLLFIQFALPIPKFIITAAVVSVLWLLVSCAGSHQRDVDNHSPVLTPEEERGTFQLSPELDIRLVAAEPMVQDPVVIQFDPDGHLWVVEMRGFMADIDGKLEKEPTGRISVLKDTNSDGQMDMATVYLDSLILPRAIAFAHGGVLVAENKKLWFTKDVNNDHIADEKELVDSLYADGPSPEHSSNGLLYNIDNWFYNARSRFRYQFINNRWIKDSTEFRGQWGITHDDEGRLYYNYNWSQLHADLIPPNYFSRNINHTPTTGIDHGLTNDRRINPIRTNPAVNRGYVPGTLDSAGKLQEFTAACSPFYYRESLLPEAYQHNVFVCEPAGNLIKRNVLEEKSVMIAAVDPFPGKEFLASADERFRPVHITAGPDGALYVADMYRGLIQHGTYVTPYLRETTIKRGLQSPVHKGRIWKIVPKAASTAVIHPMSKLPSADLVTALSNNSGWVRDHAHRLLVERNDPSVFPALKKIVLQDGSPLSRLHALWILNSLEQTDAGLLINVLQSDQVILSNAALRMIEPIARNNAHTAVGCFAIMQQKIDRASEKQLIQFALSSNILSEANQQTILLKIADRFSESALIRDAMLSSLYKRESSFLEAIFHSPYIADAKPYKEIFIEMLSVAVLRNNDPAQSAQLLALINQQKEMKWPQQTILSAISIHSANPAKKLISLQAKPAVLSGGLLTANAKWKQAIETVFSWPGHQPDTGRQTKQSNLNENERRQFVAGRQIYLTNCSGCHGTNGEGLNRFAPPLVNSEWVLGDEKRLVLLLLHGLEGPLDVNGKKYDAPDILPVMPAHSTMDDGDIAAVLTYIRNEWTNAAPPVSNSVVGKTRHLSQGRVVPWTPADLNKHILATKTKEGK
jgi:mono/diheme cytochrome c family protein/glucose/arabinose dehydrogenase